MSGGGNSALRIAAGIATSGRPRLLGAALDALSCQRRVADRLIVCAPDSRDVAGVAADQPEIEIIYSPRGLTRQRNEILRRAGDCDIVVFFDDDFLPDRGYLGVVERVFSRRSDIVLMTGLVMADGIIGPGLGLEEAREAFASGDDSEPADDAAAMLREVYNGYGCNMAVRLAPVREHRIQFDENLPLYGWLEDIDFSRQLAGYGGIVKASEARGVHLGVKQGRQPGARLGYSQIANPIYLVRKGTCRWQTALRLMSRNLAANALRSLRPEPYIDRMGRAAGNVRAIRDLIAGRLAPQRALDL